MTAHNVLREGVIGLHEFREADDFSEVQSLPEMPGSGGIS